MNATKVIRFIVYSLLLMVFLLQQTEAQNPAANDSAATKQDTGTAETKVINYVDAPDAKPVKKFMTGADQVKAYVTFLKGKRVAVVINQTSMIGSTSVIDTLLKLKINVVAMFTPEHGLKGDAPAGKKVANTIDEKTNVPIISLYGDHLKPTKKDLKEVDVVLFDIQDVGARFYTYISTLHNVMEACAENAKFLIVLDRPNPNGHYVDGPMLNIKYRSFVGMDPIPVVYGLTMGELAQMINREGWIKGGPCQLRIIKMKNYSHNTMYQLPVWPSPNLTDMKAVYLYPSLCFFEGTKVSVGRGTDKPFQQIGYPGFKDADATFTPQSTDAAPDPMYKDTLCSGWEMTHYVEDSANVPRQINLTWLLKMYESYPDKTKFFNAPFFDKLAGGPKLREQIQKGLEEGQIRDSWQDDLKEYMTMRKKYLLYEDFGVKVKKGAAKPPKKTKAPVQQTTTKGKKK